MQKSKEKSVQEWRVCLYMYMLLCVVYAYDILIIAYACMYVYHTVPSRCLIIYMGIT